VMRQASAHRRGNNPVGRYKCVTNIPGNAVDGCNSCKGDKHAEKRVINGALSGFVLQKEPNAFK
jgi:hypothetical protein